MRHRIGIVLAIVMAGVLFFAGSWGYLGLLRLPAPAVPLSGLPAGGGSLLSFHGVLAALAAVAATGLLAGILIAAPRISPARDHMAVLGRSARCRRNSYQGSGPSAPT